MITCDDHVINFELIKTARGHTNGFGKRAFIPASDPSMGGAPPGGDPSQGGGGAPPPGGDPSMGGGAPPPPDAGGGGGGGGGGATLDMVMQQMQQMQQQIQQMQMGGGGGGAGGGGAGGAGGLKPKIDQNMVSVQILKTLARICDHLQIHVPMSDMVPGMGDLNQLASATQGQAPMPGAGGGDPSGGAGGAGGAGAIGGMPPMDPMQGAGQPGAQKMGAYRSNGVAFDTSGLSEIGHKAAMISRIRKLGRP